MLEVAVRLPEEGAGVSFGRQSGSVDSVEGEARCDASTLTCLFSNLLYREGQFMLYVRDASALASVAGALMMPGIGAPAPYYYLDTWSHFPHLAQDDWVREAQARIATEQGYNPDRPFRAISVRPLEQLMSDRGRRTVVETLTIIFALQWPRNLFRVLYAGAVALFTAYEWSAIPASATVKLNAALLDVDPEGAGSFACLIKSFGSVQTLAGLAAAADGVWYRTAIFGLSQVGLLPEQAVAFPDRSTSLRSSAFKFYGTLTRRWISNQLATPALQCGPRFARNDTALWERRHQCALLGLQGDQRAPRVTLVIRRGAHRQILNLRELISHLRTLRISLKVVMLEDHPLEEQVRIIYTTDLLIAVHGAALGHLLFARPEAAVIELFPFLFRKTIYRNLANLLGVRYASWQCPRASCSQKAAVTHPTTATWEVDWQSQESKDYWRNQSIHLDMVEFTLVLDLTLRHLAAAAATEQASEANIPIRGRRDRGEKFLIYLPWEQFNNQLVGFKSACAVATFLNRTLVVPPIGHRRPLPAEIERRVAGVVRVFAPKEYEWRPWTRYFDSAMLRRLPCRTAPFDAFTSLTRGVETLLLRRLGQSARVNHHQLEDYFFHVASLEYNKVASLPSYFPLYFDTAEQIRHYLGRRFDRERVLALGTMFWAYSFQSVLAFPLRRYEDKLSDPLYSQITRVFAVHPDLQAMAAELRARLPLQYNALHLRRGDYGQKCYDEGMGASQEEEVLQSCYQRPIYLVGRLREIRDSALQPKNTTWFLATNDHNLVDLRRHMKRLGTPTIILSELLDKAKIAGLQQAQLDPIDMSILDQLLCVGAQNFVGNYFSSFTRTIVETRQLAGKSSNFF